MLTLILVVLIAGFLLYLQPRVLPMESNVQLILRAIVIILLLAYAFQVISGRRLF